MFEKHFGLRENPFPAGHQLRFLYPSREHQEARAHLRYGIENREPFVLITGEVGTGKTTALYDALAEWGAQVSVALITNSALTRSELLEEICLRFGVAIPAGSSKPKMLALLERHLLGVRSRGEHAVLLLDEAQNLATELLEEIRLLSNVESQGEKLMQIFLVGQPELEARLARPELRQLRQRITVHYRLNPLSPEETSGYIHHRLSVAGGNAWATFPPESCREVYRVTHGIPREINTVASQAMITAYSENAPSVTIGHVRAAAHEGEFRSVLAENDLKLPSAADLAAALNERTVEPEPVAPPPLPPPPPAPVSSIPSPHAEAPPAWTPPVLEKSEERVENVMQEELDAWSAAASGLMKARQRAREGGVEPTSYAAQAYARAESPVPPPAPAETPRFPTPAELHERGAEADPANADLGALPQRLREKIEQELEAEERGRARALPWMLAVAAIAVVIVGILVAQRLGVIALPFMRGASGTPAIADTTASPVASAAATAKPASRPATPDTTSRPAPGPSAAATGPAASPAQPVTAPPRPTEPAPAKPAPQNPEPAATTPAQSKPAPAPVPAKPATTTIYGIAVGNYLEEARAGQESARLADATGMPGRVVRYLDAGTAMYRVVLGNFNDESSAEKAADHLLSRPGIREARVVVLAKTIQR